MSIKTRVSRALSRIREATPRTGSGAGAGERAPAAQTLTAIGVELAKLVREMLVIPAQLWLGLAEPIGQATLWVWRRVVKPLAIIALELAGWLYRLALRHVTPARATTVVALVAIGVLVASQWVDYRGVRVGTDAYAGDAGLVAPAPEVARESAGEAHSWVMLPLAAAALVVLAVALAGRRRLARLLILIGIAAIAIAVLIDAPNGLDEGRTAVAYEGASAHLLEGFWLQLAAATGLIVSGVLLPTFLRPELAAERTRRRRPRTRRPRERATMPVGEART